MAQCSHLHTVETSDQRHSGHTAVPQPLADTGTDQTRGCICCHGNLQENICRLRRRDKCKSVVLIKVMLGFFYEDQEYSSLNGRNLRITSCWFFYFCEVPCDADLLQRDFNGFSSMGEWECRPAESWEQTTVSPVEPLWTFFPRCSQEHNYFWQQ